MAVKYTSYERLKDDSFVKKLSPQVMNAFHHLRSRAKGVTDSRVAASYRLLGSEEEVKKRLQLVLADDNYLYPEWGQKQKYDADRSRPYLHPCILQSCQEFGWKAKSSPGRVHASCFESSLASKPDELEMPIPMVAMITASARVSFNQYSDGYFKAQKFNKNSISTVYEYHVGLLTNLKSSKPKKFHEIMSTIYSFASNRTVNTKPDFTKPLLIETDVSDPSGDEDQWAEEDEWTGVQHDNTGSDSDGKDVA